MPAYRRILGAALAVAAMAGTATPAAEAFEGRNGLLAYPFGTRGWIDLDIQGASGIGWVVRAGVTFTHPRWSADGTRLLLTGAAAGEGRQLWVVDVRGATYDDPWGVSVTGLRRLTAPGGGDNTGGAWSPDGRHIAYVHTPPGGVSQVWRMRADGTQRRQLAWSPLGTADPDWSPDGREIAFTTWPVNAADHGPRIFAMNAADGTAKRKITVVPGRRPAWSPDGTQLAFEAVAPVSSIDVVRRDGQRLRTVRATDAPGLMELRWPRWSPDSTQLVATVEWHESAATPASMMPSFMSLSGEWLTTIFPYEGDDADWGPLPDGA